MWIVGCCCAYRDKDILEAFISQFLDSLLFFKMELDAIISDKLDISLNSFHRDSEFRNDICNNATGSLFFFKYACIETRLSKEVCCSKACRTCSDDSSLHISWFIWFFPHYILILIKALLCTDSLDFSYLYRSFVIHSCAVVLALMVTDPTCYIWKSVCCINKAQCFSHSALSCKSYILRNRLVNRTSFYTWSYIAVEERKRCSDFCTLCASEIFSCDPLWIRDLLYKLSKL